MQQLIDDANEYAKSIGQAGDLSMDSFADIVQAVELVQEKQGVAGTTAKEAMTTIEGSATATKAAWENVMTAIGKGEGLSEAMQGLATSIFGDESGGGLLNNVIPRLQTTMEGIGGFIETAAPYITDALPTLIEAVLPPLIESAFTLMGELGAALPGIIESLTGVVIGALGTLYTNVTEQLFGQTPATFEELIALICTSIETGLPQLLSQGAGMIGSLIQGIFTMLPTIITTGIQIITALLTALITSLPQLLTQGAAMMGNIANGLLSNIPALLTSAGTALSQLLAALMNALPGMLNAGIELLLSVANGIVQNLPAIVTAAAQVIAQLLATFVQHLPQLLQQGIELIGKLAAGIIQAIPTVVAAIPQVISGITSAFKGFDWVSIGTQIINGIKNGIVNAASSIANAAIDAAKGALNGVKNFLGIKSPSRVFRDQVGKMMAEGMGIGFEDNVPADDIQGAISDMQKSLRVDDIGIPVTAEGNSSEGNRSTLPALLEGFIEQLKSMGLYLDGKLLVGGIADDMDDALGQRAAYAGRYI